MAPKEPIVRSEPLQALSEQLTQSLIPIGPLNITKCYEYAEPRRDVIKTASVYFTETIEDIGEDQGLERRITVSIYPCKVMAENMGVRGTIDIRHYECPSPCQKAKDCIFRAAHKGFFYEASRG